ncbi:hypothetical protein Esti_004551 [Eimeria stiedai]
MVISSPKQPAAGTRLRYASLAAALAVQAGVAGVVPSLAAGGEGEKPTQEDQVGAVEPSPVHSLFSTGPFFDMENSFASSFSSFMNLFAPMQSLMPSVVTSLSLSLPMEEGDKSCYIDVKIGEGVRAEGVKFGLQTSGRRVTVAYSSESVKEESDPEKGTRWVSSPGEAHDVLRDALAAEAFGWGGKRWRQLAALARNLIIVKDGGERHALIVLPSSELLGKYIEDDKLSGNVLTLLSVGDKQALDELPPLQRCMSAGFTEEDCGKLGGMKPDVVSVASFDGPGNVVPIPLYDVSLDRLK